MEIVMRAWSSDEDCWDPPYLATLSLDQDRIDLILRQCAMVDALRQDPSIEGRSLTSVQFWDYSPQWWHYSEQAEELELAVEFGLDDGWAIATSTPELPEETQVRQDCTRLVITGADLGWRSYIKHTNIPMHTATITRDELLELNRKENT